MSVVKTILKTNAINAAEWFVILIALGAGGYLLYKVYEAEQGVAASWEDFTGAVRARIADPFNLGAKTADDLFNQGDDSNSTPITSDYIGGA